MSALFELKSNDAQQYYFNFLDGNGQLLLISSEYDNKGDAEQAIREVRVGSLVSQHIAAGQVPDGKTFFVIRNAAGDVLVKSILFESRMVFDNALHAVKDSACVAEINDLT